MSLSSFIKIPLHRKKIKEYFPRPNIRIQGKIKSRPISNSHTIIGIAVDYLIRFNIKYLFPQAKESIWVSEIRAIQKDKHLKKYVDKAKNHYHKFLNNGKVSKELLNSSIDLAKIDMYVRSGYYPEYLGRHKKADIFELNNILKNIDFAKFIFTNRCILNPSFGQASRLVGGADADLIIDNQLIDIKNTVKLSITREMLNQMIGYYFLGRIGKVKGVSDWSSIEEIGFFFPRYDLLYTIPINEFILPDKRNSFEKWFRKNIALYNKFS